MQMIIHHGEATNGNTEGSGEQLEPIFDPLLAVFESFSAEKGSSHTAR
jgi:hypothetical protein